MLQTRSETERVLLVGIDKNLLDEDIDSSMEELSELAKASGAEVIASVVQRKLSKDPRTLIGPGKAEEIYNYCEELDIDTVIFNEELSGSQIRNLEKIIDRNIVDRTNLILDIFAQRANTNEGKLQVKLAQLKYRLPRLSGSGQYLSRLGGGIGTRGPGEQKLESDRRHITREIGNIERKLKLVEKNREILRAKRSKSNIPIVALTGYTNSGKSTLVNSLIRNTDGEESREVFVKDMLFATLGTSLRRSEFNNGREFLLIDTVGFVSKLPTHLIAAFKSTLEEIRFADIIVQVVDVTNTDVELQIETTNKILLDLNLSDKKMIYAFNKIDMLEEGESLNRFKIYEPYVLISAKNKTNLDELLDVIYSNLSMDKIQVKMFFNYDEQNILNYFVEKYSIKDVEYTELGSSIEGQIEESDYNYYIKNVVKE